MGKSMNPKMSGFRKWAEIHEPTKIDKVRRSRLFGQVPGRNKLKAGSRLLVSPFPEIKFILSRCGVL
jgi:hypothetical protein